MPKVSKTKAFALACHVQEDHKKPIYCVAFNHTNINNLDCFASVGANRATIYRCKPDGALELLQCYADEDVDEAFFACTWSIDEESGNALLLFAGRNSVIRIVDTIQEKVVRSIIGHGESINDLKVHPKHPAMILSASQDESVRVWNIKTGVCALIFGGEEGHRNEVLSCDWHPKEQCTFVSSGMDCIVKVWEADGPYLETFQQALGPWDKSPGMFPTRYVQCPRFSTYQVHRSYVDCVRWYDDVIVSKTVDSTISFWIPETDPSRKGEVTVVQQLKLRNADIWFIRFAFDLGCRTLACGSRAGQVRIWDTSVVPAALLATFSTQSSKSKAGSPVRQCYPSHDGRIVVGCCEDGSIYRWDETKNGERERICQAAKERAAKRLAGPGAQGLLDSDGDGTSSDSEGQQQGRGKQQGKKRARGTDG